MLVTAQQMPSSLEIAHSAVLRPIDGPAAELRLLPEEVDFRSPLARARILDIHDEGRTVGLF
jgi:hypothetical protein